MFLKSLELSGFKSFAKRTVLTFEPGTTAVVGPNGSGKSNIADAVRWVLGAQSKKAVRGKAASDVIFSGTVRKAPMGLAEVSLTFDNAPVKPAGGKPGEDAPGGGSGSATGSASIGERHLPYDYDEVVVTRRLYRSGDAEYAVNGSRVRLADLQHAFAVAGIGAENYTVIGQGMVDRVLSQSARERRGLFEEAAGIKQFQLKRDQARRRLTETDTNLGRLADIVRELEPRLKLLRRQASGLAQREQVESGLKDAYRARYGHRYRELSDSHGQATAKQADLNREFVAMQQELAALGSLVDGLRRSRQGLKLNDLLTERDTLRDERERLTEAQSQSATAIEVAKVQQEQAEPQKRELTDRLEALEAHAPAPAAAESEAETKRLTAVRQQLGEIERRYQTLKQSMAETASVGDGDATERVLVALEALEVAVNRGAPHAELAKLVTRAKQALAQTGSSAGSRAATTTDQLDGILQERDQAQAALKELEMADAARREAARLRVAETQRQESERSAVEGRLKALAGTLERAAQTIATQTERTGTATAELKKTDKRLAALDADIATEQQSTLGETEELEAQEKALRQKQSTFESYRRELSELNVELARSETRLDELAKEAKAKLGPAFPPAPDEALPSPEAGAEDAIAKLERKLLELGAIDPGVREEAQEVEQRFAYLTSQSADLTTAKGDLEKLIGKLERQSREMFKDSFAKIQTEFSTYFTKLFGGGAAELVMVADEEPAEEAPSGGSQAAGGTGDEVEGADEATPTQDRRHSNDFGVDIKATPPGKRVQSLAMLSGGERALTSVALLFAILTVNPSPFVMLDEVDAALDEANTSRFAETLGVLASRTQFIVVTHNRDTMKAAQTLYGVTMDETGISTLLSLKLAEAEKVAQAA